MFELAPGDVGKFFVGVGAWDGDLRPKIETADGECGAGVARGWDPREFVGGQGGYGGVAEAGVLHAAVDVVYAGEGINGL